MIGLHVDPGDQCHPIHQSPLIRRTSKRLLAAHRFDEVQLKRANDMSTFAR